MIATLYSLRRFCHYNRLYFLLFSYKSQSADGLRADELFELCLGQQAFFQHDLPNRFILCLGLFGDPTALFVPKRRQQCDHDGGGRFNRPAAAVFVGFKAFDAMPPQDVTGRGQQVDAVQQIGGDQRQKGVQFEASGREGPAR